MSNVHVLLVNVLNFSICKSLSPFSLSLTSLVSGAAPVGVDSQRSLHAVSSVWLGDVCGRHFVDPHHHPLPHDPVRRPAKTHLCPLAPDGRKGRGEERRREGKERKVE